MVRAGLRRVPGKPALIRAFAKAPPLIKPPLVCSILSRMIEPSELEALGAIETNLGALHHDIAIAAPAPLCYFFGTPESYRGEIGALLLSLELSRSSRVFVDIGAHHGYFLFFVRDRLEKPISIHYLEPNPALFRQIEANVRRHGLTDVHGHELAIGARSGPSAFFTNVSAPASSSLTRDFANQHVLREDRVDVRSFDDFASEHDLHDVCAKVDIENAEFAFLEGAQGSSQRLRFLIIEVLGPAASKGFVNAAIAQLGMHAYYINDLRLEHSSAGEYTYRHPYFNWLFCRESPAELRKLLAGSRLTVAA
jgi:FkbM family methyltransferase